MVYKKLNSTGTLIQKATMEAPQNNMYYIGLDVHKKTISYCIKDASGQSPPGRDDRGDTERAGRLGTGLLPEPRMIAMEATIFTGWIYDHLLPHAEKVKVAHPLMLRAIAAAKKKNDRDRCRQDRRLPALRFPAGMPHGFHRDQGSAPYFALPAPAGAPDGADEEPDFGATAGNRCEP